MRKLFRLVVVLSVLTPRAFGADDIKVEPLNQPAPADVAEVIRGELQPTGIRVLSGTEPLVELWFRKSIPVVDGPPGMARSYPKLPDTALLGAARVVGNMKDNRDHAFPKGVYTIRHGLQPQDGNHVGSSEFSDFALFLKAAADTTVQGKFENPRAMIMQSLDDGGAGHPIVFAMLEPSDGQLKVERNSENRWVLHTRAGDSALAIVIVGVYEH